MIRALTPVVFVCHVALVTSGNAWAQAQDPDCTQNFIGHVRSQFQSQLAGAEPIKVFVVLSKRITTPAGAQEVFVSCDAPHVGKGPFTTDPSPGDVVDTWEPILKLAEVNDPIPPRATALDEYYPTTRPFLEQDRSFVQGEKWEVYPPDLDSPNCYYYYQNGDKKKYCW